MDDNTSKKGHNNKNISLILGLCLVIVAIIVIILFFLKGNTVISNTGGDTTTTEALACESSKVSYPYFTYDNSTKKNMKINIIFMNNKIDSISLIYNLYYNSAEEINRSESLNHAEMNKNFATKGLDADSLDAKYSKLDTSLQMTLNAETQKINEISARYFLLDKAASSYNMDSLSKQYNSKGLDCKIYK